METGLQTNADTNATLELYRRPLPRTCISFSSCKGKEIFREAMLSGQMDCFFKLAGQFRTQDEPAYCGLSTLVMILNALEIDPQRIWKEPWRWYHEDMLGCCISLKLAKEEGITFDEFISLAKCNGLETSSNSVGENDTVESFRNIVRLCTLQDELFLVVSYSRHVLDQTGDGHFSPVGGYHSEKDLVLIMDTARFKYPPHWIPTSLLFQAMQTKDEKGEPRGYITLKRGPPIRKRH